MNEQIRCQQSLANATILAACFVAVAISNHAVKLSISCYMAEILSFCMTLYIIAIMTSMLAASQIGQTEAILALAF